MPCRLSIFVKAPRPGEVKSRLAGDLGPAAAAQVYAALLGTVCRRLSGLPGGELAFAPDDAADELEPYRPPGWALRPQGAGDLGARLLRTVQQLHADGADRIVIIGSDCPDVAPGDITDAWAALETEDVALGPAADGGYWLIGLRQPRPALFADIPWSTDRVLAETRERCRRLGLRLRLLRQLRDVDTVADLGRFDPASGGFRGGED
jgi:hypothetical protein